MRLMNQDLYPTRGQDFEMIERLDPVIWGDGEGPLDQELVSSFEEHGFLTLPAFLSPSTVQALEDEVRDLANDPEVRSLERAIYEPLDDELRSLFAVHEDSGALSDVTRNPQLVAIAQQLLGDDVYIHQSRVNLKPGFRGTDFYWHSDFETWHSEDGMPRMRAVSCSVQLTPNTTTNGPLMVIDGSHEMFVSCAGLTPENHYLSSLREQEYGVPNEDSLRALVNRGRITQCLGRPGTVVFFDCNLMHGSASNITPDPRQNVFTVYNAVSNALVEPFGGTEPRPDFIANRNFAPL